MADAHRRPSVHAARETHSWQSLHVDVFGMTRSHAGDPAHGRIETKLKNVEEQDRNCGGPALTSPLNWDSKRGAASESGPLRRRGDRAGHRTRQDAVARRARLTAAEALGSVPSVNGTGTQHLGGSRFGGRRSRGRLEVGPY